MDRDTPTTSPVTMHAVVITKPYGEPRPVVRFGPLTQVIAGEWAACLRQQLNSSAPEGTTVGVEKFDPEIDGCYIDPDSIPRGIDDLMPAFRDQPPGNGGANFPDLYARLVMVHGYTRASEMWDQACRTVGAEEAVSEAEADICMAAADARAGIEDALPTVERAAVSVRAAIGLGGKWDLGVPASVAVYPADAAEHLADAARSLRAAALALAPVSPEGTQP
jgi:hypothetical protein